MLKSNPSRYGAVPFTIHWLTAISSAGTGCSGVCDTGADCSKSIRLRAGESRIPGPLLVYLG